MRRRRGEVWFLCIGEALTHILNCCVPKKNPMGVLHDCVCVVYVNTFHSNVVTVKFLHILLLPQKRHLHNYTITPTTFSKTEFIFALFTILDFLKVWSIAGKVLNF